MTIINCPYCGEKIEGMSHKCKKKSWLSEIEEGNRRAREALGRLPKMSNKESTYERMARVIRSMAHALWTLRIDGNATHVFDDLPDDAKELLDRR